MATFSEDCGFLWNTITEYQDNQIGEIHQIRDGLRGSFHRYGKAFMKANSFDEDKIDGILDNCDHIDVNTLAESGQRHVINNVCTVRERCQPRYEYAVLFLIAPVEPCTKVELCNISERRKKMLSSVDMLEQIYPAQTGNDDLGLERKMSGLSLHGTEPVYNYQVKTNTLLPRALNKEKDFPAYGSKYHFWQQFLDSLDNDIEHGLLSFNCKPVQRKLTKTTEFHFSGINYELSLDQEEEVRRWQCEEMLKIFPVPISDNYCLRFEHIIAPVMSEADVEEALAEFESLAKESMKAYIIFNGHGSPLGDLVFNEGKVPHAKILDLIDRFETKLAENTIYPGGPSIPASIEFVAAQCYSHMMKVPGYLQTSVTKLSSSEVGKQETHNQWMYAKAPVMSSSGKQRKVTVVHCELNEWATSTQETEDKAMQDEKGAQDEPSSHVISNDTGDLSSFEDY